MTQADRTERHRIAGMMVDTLQPRLFTLKGAH
jgi:hypothetical protein